MKRNVILMFLVSLMVVGISGCIWGPNPSITTVTLNVGSFQTFSVNGLFNGPYTWSWDKGSGFVTIPGASSGPSYIYTAVGADVGTFVLKVDTYGTYPENPINKHYFQEWTVTVTDPIVELLNSMVPIPAGTFMMGSTDNQYNQAQYTTPVHAVTLPAFNIGAYEVKQTQYQEVMSINPSYHQCPSCPVERVDWNEAREFCTKLSMLTGRIFSLPSEAQWEYACRAGTQTLYSYGSSDAQLGKYAWYGANSGNQTHPVGTKLPNPWGLYDMMGNVWEWCLDSWHDNYVGAPTDGSAWEPDTGPFRMLRGGGWYDDLPWYFRSATRTYSDLLTEDSDTGFRIVECVNGIEVPNANNCDDVEAAGFVCSTVFVSSPYPVGTVISQSPDPYTMACPGSTVQLVISSGPCAPIADAGPDQTIAFGQMAQLDGSASTDPFGCCTSPLTYEWTIVSEPAGSNVILSNSTIVNPTFTPDINGVYVIQLIVYCGTTPSVPDIVTITA